MTKQEIINKLEDAQKGREVFIQSTRSDKLFKTSNIRDEGFITGIMMSLYYLRLPD